MDKLRVKLLAFAAADAQEFTKGKRRLKNLFKQDVVEFVDKDPDVLVFLSGGAERNALQSVREFSFYLLLASSVGNSWAAATEVKAWMNQNHIDSLLIDQDSPMAPELIDNLHRVKNGLKRLRGQRFGLVGDVSDWLVNSNIDAFTIKSKLGIERVDIPWERVSFDRVKKVSSDFLSFFPSDSTEELTQSGVIYEGLSEVIRRYDLTALTVQCFSLIQKRETTACLPLSKLSMDGITAACEGDMCSLLGMMITKELFGVVPWMANTNYVDEKANSITFSHCTVPANLLKKFKVTTHFESGKGMAVQGELKAEEVTIVRIDHTLTKMFVGKGVIIPSEHNEYMCRTQIVVRVEEEVVRYFLDNPLGNHHIIVPDDYALGFELAARLLRMELV